MTTREKVMHLIDTLSEKQMETVLHILETLPTDELPSDYDEANDPAIGFISGPTDVSERVEEILKARSQRYSGWTRKDEL